MGCDLCGYIGEEIYKAQIEGSLMNVCKKCLKFGALIENKNDFDIDKIVKTKSKKEEPIFLLKENYNLLIKELREKLNLTQEELAKKLNERASLIHKIENKELDPNEAVINKFENFFKIKLIENYQEDAKFDFKKSSLTIGDLLKFKNLKK